MMVDEEKKRIVHNDARERELQESREIQRQSEAVLRLVDRGSSNEFSSEIIASNERTQQVEPESSLLNGKSGSTAPVEETNGEDMRSASIGSEAQATEANPRETGLSSMDTTPTLSVVAVKVCPEEEEERVLRRMMGHAVAASLVVTEGIPKEENQTPKRTQHNRKSMLVTGIAFLVICGLVVGLAVGLTQSKGGSKSPQQAPSLTPTLQSVRERGVLRCGSLDQFFLINYDENGERVGLIIDLCKAFAAGIFGEKSKHEIVDVLINERFDVLANNSIDVLFRAAPTMNRDVKETSRGHSFQFTVPYVYADVGFGGKESWVKCADDLNTRGECSNLMVCTVRDTTFTQIAQGILPSAHILVGYLDDIVHLFAEGRCNVVIGLLFDLNIVMVQREIFGPGHSVGKPLVAQEPLSIVTRDDDPEWSDMMNWMLQSLFEAEKLDITKDNAGNFSETLVFGEEYRNIFRNVVAAGGNYGELYDRNIGLAFPRKGMNLINTNHGSGIIWTPSFEGVSNSGPGPTSDGELERISGRGYLMCGVTDTRPGFADFNSTSRIWSGLDVDFCHAVGSSVFHGVVSNETVRFVEFEAVEDAYKALADRSVDVLCGQLVTLGADILGYGSGQGAAFSLPYFYEADGNRALAVRQSDPQWSPFVYWTVASTIYAEQKKITQAAPNEMPTVNLFGSRYRRMLRDAILLVGNYGEIYSRNLESLFPRSGLNLLNAEPVGPQIFPLSFAESAP